METNTEKVVEAYRLDRYDNSLFILMSRNNCVVEAYRLDRYDNFSLAVELLTNRVVEAYRLDRYDNSEAGCSPNLRRCCRSLSFG